MLLGMISPPGVISQTPEVDSLKALLLDAKPDTNKVMWLADIAFYLYNVQPEKSIKYGQEALDLARQIGFKRGEGNALYKLSIAQYSLGNYDEAIQYAQDGVKVFDGIGYDLGVYYCYNILGIVYRVKSDAEKALKYGFLSAKFSHEHDDTISEAIAFSNIGTIYLDCRDTANAKKYFLQAIDIFRRTNQLSNVTEVLTNLSTVESDTAQKFRYIRESIELGKQIGYEGALSYAYHNLGNFLWKQRRQPLQALPKYNTALHFANKTNDYYEKTLLNIDIGALYNELEKLDSAQFYLQTGLNLAEEQGMKEQVREGYQTLAGVQKKTGNYRQAFESLSRSQEIADSLYQVSLAEKLADADARYETSKKEAQITEQQLEIARQRNATNNVLIGGLIVLLLTTGVFQYFFYKQRRKKRETELALELEHREGNRLRELNELKTRFFTNISHELRTPLTLIISPLEEVLKQLKQVNLQGHLSTAHRNSKKLLNLVNEILDLSKMEAGKMELSKTKVGLEPLLRRIFFSYQPVAQLHGVDLKFYCSKTAGAAIETDVPKIEKILNNLLSNALKFSPKGSTIAMRASLEEGQLSVSVTDGGPGILPADLPYIFDRFYQSKSPESRIQGGTGIGLALSKQLAQLLGGSLTAENQPQKGTKLTLSLPVAVSAATALAPEAEDPASTEANQLVANDTPLYMPLSVGAKPRLLIVEDNREMSEYLTGSLSKNYECTLAYDGVEALNILEKGTFDLITSDVMMPHMDGFTLREKINENPDWQRIPFILLTARTLEADRLKGFQLGVDDYITKPFSLPEVEARIRNLLQNKASRENWEKDAALGTANATHPDEQLLRRAEKLVMKKLDDPTFNVEVMAKNLGYSSRHLSRVLGRLTGLSPVQFILELRLQYARRLLEKGQYATISEVRYEIGIESASYFTKKFTERFGKNPSEFLG